jgi:hypothetical protein
MNKEIFLSLSKLKKFQNTKELKMNRIAWFRRRRLKKKSQPKTLDFSKLLNKD